VAQERYSEGRPVSRTKRKAGKQGYFSAGNAAGLFAPNWPLKKRLINGLHRKILWLARRLMPLLFSEICLIIKCWQQIKLN
jgi:hypothetical protein